MERFVGAVSLTAMMWCLASIAQEPVTMSDGIIVRSNWMSTALEFLQRPQSATRNSSATSNVSRHPSAKKQIPTRSIAQEVVLSRATLASILVHKFQLQQFQLQQFQLQQKSQQARPQVSQGLQVLTQLVTSIITSENRTSENRTSENRTAEAAASKNITPKDIAPTHWAYADIQTVLRLGIMSMQRQGQFLPNQRVTRVEAFSSIAQASSIAESQGEIPVSDRTVEQILDRYPDATSIPDWARRSMATALQKGFVNLRQGDRIDPHSPMTTSDLAHALTVYRQQQNYFSQLDITRLGVVD